MGCSLANVDAAIPPADAGLRWVKKGLKCIGVAGHQRSSKAPSESGRELEGPEGVGSVYGPLFGDPNEGVLGRADDEVDMLGGSSATPGGPVR